MDILKQKCGVSRDGKDIIKYVITNASGASVALGSVGAGILEIRVPDRDGHKDDVVIGYPDPLSYFADGPCAGKVPGRYANRIARGHLEVDGKVYELPINNGPNHLHGGPEGFQNQVWESRIDGDAVEFLYDAADGEMGYPGGIKVVARYEWSEKNELRLTLTARCDAPTVVNLTNHAYFNLEGHGAGSVFDHELRLNASLYLPTDDTLIPLGEPEAVAGTPMDFLKPKPIGRDIKEDFPALNYGKGYDACWVIDGWEEGQLQEAGELYAPKSGRCMKVYTTQPGIQIYTGNWLEGCPAGKDGAVYHDYSAVAMECQHFPDSPNRPYFPTTVLNPGEVYTQTTIYRFGVE
jgi:aldose 1-epimerase